MGFLFPGTKQTVRNNEMSVKGGLTVIKVLYHFVTHILQNSSPVKIL